MRCQGHVRRAAIMSFNQLFHIYYIYISYSGRPQVLDEIQAGIFDGMTYAEIEQNMPEEFAARKADKLGYRSALASGEWC